VLVTTRLLELADRPEEIAGVVAHELHMSRRNMVSEKLFPARLIISKFSSQFSRRAAHSCDSSELLIRQSFSQEYELEADDVGWQSLVNAHIDHGLGRHATKAADRATKMHAGMGRVNAFSSHPATEKPSSGSTRNGIS